MLICVDRGRRRKAGDLCRVALTEGVEGRRGTCAGLKFCL